MQEKAIKHRILWGNMKIDLQVFGGRGAGIGGGGGGASGELTLPDGSKIEFEGNLQYDGDDASLTGKARQEIANWEAKRANAKIEYAYAVDAQGNPIGNEIRGGKGSVRVPRDYHDSPDCTFTHNHPREDGLLGGTFSEADLRNFAKFRNKTVRAKAKEGTYSISKGKNFDETRFRSYISDIHSKCDKTYSTRQRAINQSFAKKQISFDEYRKQSAKSFNTMLVDLHNGYKAGERLCGYTYTLEKGR